MLFLVMYLNLCGPSFLNCHVSLFCLPFRSVIFKAKSMKIKTWPRWTILCLFSFTFIILKRQEHLLSSVLTISIYWIIFCNITAYPRTECLVFFPNRTHKPENIDDIFTGIKEYFSMASNNNLPFGVVQWSFDTMDTILTKFLI